MAWSLEVTLLVGSIGIPTALGQQVQNRAENPQQTVSPALRVVQHQVGRLLALPRRSLPERVTPLTQLLWSGAVGLPLVLVGVYVYGLSRRGSSGPKRWLGLQVVTLQGYVPGWRRVLLREGLGRWGLPLVLAYGVWRISGGFPMSLALLGWGAGALVLENLTGLLNRSRRPWHDGLAGTCVVDRQTGAMVRLAAQWHQGEAHPANAPGALAWAEEHGGLTAVVLEPPQSGGRRWSPWWVAIALLLGTGLGAGGYGLWQRQTTQGTNQELFMGLVATLTDPDADDLARRLAVLTLGSVQDDRAIPLLVDLIAQADDPATLDALRQALVNRGPAALPALKRQNQRLSRELATTTDGDRRLMLTAQLQTLNQVVMEVVALAGDRIPSLDLSGLYLGALTQGQNDFVLALPQQSLAGIDWRGSVMNRAQLSGSQFYDPGPDQHRDTYDDWYADMAGADLTDATLAGADLTLSQLTGASLLRAQLNEVNLTLANLERANLERANLIQARLPGANLAQARLIAADLTAAYLPAADLRAARLRRVTADGATLNGANLQGVDALEALLTSADLSGANLRNANLTGANLAGANLTGANLTGARLRDVDLREVQLRGATLQGTDLAGALLTPPEAGVEEGFISEAPNLARGDRFAGVNFNVAVNLDVSQLPYICAQGGIHDACTGLGAPAESPSME
jgi:uncharacterized protein YjbI with pentapeptide repeats/uncharacterized RDD family membrane protein YckC